MSFVRPDLGYDQLQAEHQSRAQMSVNVVSLRCRSQSWRLEPPDRDHHLCSIRPLVHRANRWR